MKEKQRQNMGISQHDRFPLPMLAAVYGQFQVMYFEISCEIDAWLSSVVGKWKYVKEGSGLPKLIKLT